ncbi:MAG TPA: hypothetical protein VEI54_01595, partial [Candidatus Limnocylindrales bacterium]|nr:hypothetical protein [Candidatus Limnocylindrales bacterium]
MSASSNSPFSPRRAALLLVGLLLIVYLADFAWFELRVWFPKLGPASSSVHRIRLLAIVTKNNKVDYEIDSIRPEEDLPCTRSLFPHSGAR